MHWEIMGEIEYLVLDTTFKIVVILIDRKLIQFFKLQMSLANGSMNAPGVLDENGTKVTIWGFSNCMEIYSWVSPEDLENMKESRDPIDEPASPHIKPQPEYQGKLFWLSGRLSND